MPEMSETLPSLSVTERGTGEPLVALVHGWSCRRSDWDRVIDELQAQWHCLSVDLPGHGDSPALEQPLTVEGLAESLLNELRRRTQGPLILVGHSMGGCVSLEAARRWTTSPVGVVLVDTFGLPYGDMDQNTVESIAAPFREDFAGAMKGLVDNTTVPDLEAEQREWIKNRMAAGNPDVLIPLWEDLLRWSPEQAFAERRGPIVALNGEHIPEPAQVRCSGVVEETVLEGTHHFPQFEQPERFQRMLSSALSDVSGRL